MDLTADGPLQIWVVTDGRAGIEAQALGLAEAVAALTPCEITVKRVRWRRWLARLPSRLVLSARLALHPGSDTLAPPWPDLWIGNGRAAIPASIAVRRWSRAETFVVQLQDPLRDPRLFDLVVPPSHDGLTGENVFPILGSPHRMTPQRMAQGYAAFRDRLEPLQRPRVAVLVGGRSKAFDLPLDRAASLADELAEAIGAAGGSLMMTFSRRTPPGAAAVLRERLASVPGVIWDGEGASPLPAFLHAADHVVVTADSINMVTEAAATGAPVHIAAVRGRQARKDRFHATLADKGVARPFTGRLEAWPYQRLSETERAAAEVLRRLRTRSRAAA